MLWQRVQHVGLRDVICFAPDGVLLQIRLVLLLADVLRVAEDMAREKSAEWLLLPATSRFGLFALWNTGQVIPR